MLDVKRENPFNIFINSICTSVVRPIDYIFEEGGQDSSPPIDKDAFKNTEFTGLFSQNSLLTPLREREKKFSLFSVVDFYS